MTSRYTDHILSVQYWFTQPFFVDVWFLSQFVQCNSQFNFEILLEIEKKLWNGSGRIFQALNDVIFVKIYEVRAQVCIVVIIDVVSQKICDKITRRSKRYWPSFSSFHKSYRILRFTSFIHFLVLFGCQPMPWRLRK